MIPEKEREALMRLTMCARNECAICKYHLKSTFEECENRATENMHILADALDKKRTIIAIENVQYVEGGANGSTNVKQGNRRRNRPDRPDGDRQAE